MKTSIIGYPRVGSLRELKFTTEKYFRGEISVEELQNIAKEIRKTQWTLQKNTGLDFIPSNDFSFYDMTLDTAVLFNIIPERYTKLGLSALDTYFAMARGYQGAAGDVKALAMKKWFNTNYHYMVPEIDDNTEIKLAGTKPFDEFAEAKALGITTKPVIIGAFTLLKLLRYVGKKQATDYADAVSAAYAGLLEKFVAAGAEWVQFDEPYLVHDLTSEDIALFETLYQGILEKKGPGKVLLQTYFGDVRDCYGNITALAFDGIGLDFLEGRKTKELVEANGFPQDKVLFAGLVNGKNIWKNHYGKTLEVINALKAKNINVVLNTSCSLLHVPYTLKNETKLPEKYTEHFAFAEEKLQELAELKKLADVDYKLDAAFLENTSLFATRPDCRNNAVQERVAAIREDIIRAIDDMDADVITFEASRSDLLILDSLKENHFKTEVGPGVYDIHSPRVPSVEEIKAALEKMLTRIAPEKLWVNPDCGLKTRGVPETVASLKHLVEAAKELRKEA